MKSLVASSVTFKVYESGRQRVLKERRKNVHAYVCAKHISYAPPREKGLINEITYNPYKGGVFTSRELKLEVIKCHTLYLTNKKMYGDKIKYNMNIGDKQGIATSLNNIGNIYQEQGDYTKAIDYYTQSLNIT